MTDKEIIEIDGINVLECEHYQYKSLKDCEMRYPESGDCEIGLLNYLFDGNLDMEKSCKDNPNCYYKQLARKTQECEELKEKLNTVQFNFEQKCNVLKDIGVVQDNNGGYQIPELNRYRKALEEIEEYIKEEEWSLLDYVIRDINDIINKAKGEGDEDT